MLNNWLLLIGYICAGILGLSGLGLITLYFIRLFS